MLSAVANPAISTVFFDLTFPSSSSALFIQFSLNYWSFYLSLVNWKELWRLRFCSAWLTGSVLLCQLKAAGRLAGATWSSHWQWKGHSQGIRTRKTELISRTSGRHWVNMTHWFIHSWHQKLKRRIERVRHHGRQFIKAPYIHVYIYIERERERGREGEGDIYICIYR